jgi:hypothetical protein
MRELQSSKSGIFPDQVVKTNNDSDSILLNISFSWHVFFLNNF